MSWFQSGKKKKRKNIVILGCNGMLGHDVMEHFTQLAARKESKNSCFEVGIVTGIDVKDGVDVTDSHSLWEFFHDKIHYDICINCIAHTDTKAAETTAEGKIASYKLNALAVKNIATICREMDMKLIHISTDYVFSQHCGNAPFSTLADEFPCNVYGEHKLIGELYIQSILEPTDYCIMRTSWLYGAHNHKSFVHKFMKNVIRAIHEGKTEVEMNECETSMPTSTQLLVDQMDFAIANDASGIFHAVGGYESGPVTRAEFASEILRAFIMKGCIGEELEDKLCDIEVVPTHIETYQPSNSAMESSTPGFGNWKMYLQLFAAKHGKEIIEWAEEQLKIEEKKA